MPSHYNFNSGEHKEDLILGELKQHKVVGNLCQYLKSWQLDGIRFLYKHFEKAESCILNDESGLGKVVTVAAFLGAVLTNEPGKKCLVIVSDDNYIQGWLFHLTVLTRLSAKVIEKFEDIHDESVFIVKWSTIKSINQLIKITFDHIIIDNRGEMLSNNFCHGILLSCYENKATIIISNVDVTSDIKLLHIMMRLCGRIEKSFATLKSFEDKFQMPEVKDGVCNRVYLEEYFLKREKVINFCREFRLRRYRHQFNEKFPLVPSAEFKQILAHWEHFNNSESSGSVNILSSSSEKDIEELFKSYFQSKANINQNKQNTVVVESISLLDDNDQESDDTFRMSPLILESDSEVENELNVETPAAEIGTNKSELGNVTDKALENKKQTESPKIAKTLNVRPTKVLRSHTLNTEKVGQPLNDNKSSYSKNNNNKNINTKSRENKNQSNENELNVESPGAEVSTNENVHRNVTEKTVENKKQAESPKITKTLNSIQTKVLRSHCQNIEKEQHLNDNKTNNIKTNDNKNNNNKSENENNSTDNKNNNKRSNDNKSNDNKSNDVKSKHNKNINKISEDNKSDGVKSKINKNVIKVSNDNKSNAVKSKDSKSNNKKSTDSSNNDVKGNDIKNNEDKRDDKTDEHICNENKDNHNKRNASKRNNNQIEKRGRGRPKIDKPTVIESKSDTIQAPGPISKVNDIKIYKNNLETNPKRKSRGNLKKEEQKMTDITANITTPEVKKRGRKRKEHNQIEEPMPKGKKSRIDKSTAEQQLDKSANITKAQNDNKVETPNNNTVISKSIQLNMTNQQKDKEEEKTQIPEHSKNSKLLTMEKENLSSSEDNNKKTKKIIEEEKSVKTTRSRTTTPKQIDKITKMEKEPQENKLTKSHQIPKQIDKITKMEKEPQENKSTKSHQLPKKAPKQTGEIVLNENVNSNYVCNKENTEKVSKVNLTEIRKNKFRNIIFKEAEEFLKRRINFNKITTSPSVPKLRKCKEIRRRSSSRFATPKRKLNLTKNLNNNKNVDIKLVNKNSSPIKNPKPVGKESKLPDKPKPKKIPNQSVKNPSPKSKSVNNNENSTVPTTSVSPHSSKDSSPLINMELGQKLPITHNINMKESNLPIVKSEYNYPLMFDKDISDSECLINSLSSSNDEIIQLSGSLNPDIELKPNLGGNNRFQAVVRPMVSIPLPSYRSTTSPDLFSICSDHSIPCSQQQGARLLIDSTKVPDLDVLPPTANRFPNLNLLERLFEPPQPIVAKTKYTKSIEQSIVLSQWHQHGDKTLKSTQSSNASVNSNYNVLTTRSESIATELSTKNKITNYLITNIQYTSTTTKPTESTLQTTCEPKTPKRRKSFSVVMKSSPKSATSIKPQSTKLTQWLLKDTSSDQRNSLHCPPSKRRLDLTF